MKIILKIRLQLVFLSNELKRKNGHKSSAKLVGWYKGLSDNAYINVLRVIDTRWGGIGLSIEKSNKITRDLGTGVGIRQDYKLVGVPGWTKRGNKQLEDLEQDNKRVRDLRQKTEAGQDNKIAAKSAAGACTGAQRLSSCAFLLAARLFCFLTFSSLKSVIGWQLSIGSILRSGSSVTSANHNALSSKLLREQN